MHTYPRIFAMSSFIKNTNKHACLLQIFWAQNRQSQVIAEFCLDAILHSKKRSKKEQKHGLGIPMGSQNHEKHGKIKHFFISWCERQIAIQFQHDFDRYLYVNGPKNVQKSFNFHSKFMFFSLQNHHFLCSRCIDALKS